MHSLVLAGTIAIVASCMTASSLPASASFPQFEPYQEFHSLYTIPQNWEELQPSPPNALLHFKIGLTQQNVDDFHQKVLDISTPEHPSYGMHMSQAEINDMLTPADVSTQLVLEWLRSYGIQGVLDNHWVKAIITVTQANELLQTQYNTYRNKVNGDQVIRTRAYHLPATLADHVDFISPTTIFPTALRVSTDGGRHWEPHVNDSSCSNVTNIHCLQEIYRLPSIHPTDTLDKRNIFGVAGFDEEYANYQDLQSFLAKQRPDFLHTNFTFVSVNGGLNSQNLSEAGTEANLDIQVARGLAPQYETIFYSVGGLPPFIPSVANPTNSDEPFDKLLDFLFTQGEIPPTLSISYVSEEQTYPKKYAQRVCRGYAQLGARGTSVIVASGDYGVGDSKINSAQECVSNDGTNRTVFLPGLPASCPFVTSVGATVGVNPEVAVSRFGSGGGFSNYFPRPSYQATAVDSYLAKLPRGLYNGFYNPVGRAFPDVAAQGNYYPIWNGGSPLVIGGTSAATPTFAAVITLLNGQRLSQGKKPLGFLNPWLYAQGKHMLNDILLGNNPGCGTEGFQAAKGWDPVTGLGTPDFVKMQKHAPP